MACTHRAFRPSSTPCSAADVWGSTWPPPQHLLPYILISSVTISCLQTPDVPDTAHVLAAQMKEEEEMDLPKAVIRRPIQGDELAGAAEVFLVSSSLGVVPVVS